MQFSKYEGAGNDFVMIDNRSGDVRLDQSQVAQMCDRHFGIGADGLILLQGSEGAAYEMVYHNADGAIGSMCGNGARCTYAFARDIGMISGRVSFKAYDGLHEGWQEDDAISITMRDVRGIGRDQQAYVMDTGSPHYISFVEDLSTVDVVNQGRKIRNSPAYVKNGINVNFVQVHPGHLRVSTYERGVEDRTLACGTGVTAVALAYAREAGYRSGPVTLHADGGILRVDFRKEDEGFTSIVLSGPAQKVYAGTWPS